MTETTTEAKGRGGRPRDPLMAARLVQAATELTADRGPSGFTADDVATACRVGKASIYRRWSSLDELFVDVVRDLGVREADLAWADPGSVREDLITLLTAATTGTRARAELALLSVLPYRPDLRQAYTDGPLRRLAAALDAFHLRIRGRGESFADAPRPHTVQSAIAWLTVSTAHTGEQPDAELIGNVVSYMLLPRPHTVPTLDELTPEHFAGVDLRPRVEPGFFQSAEHPAARHLARDDDYTPAAVDRAQET